MKIKQVFWIDYAHRLRDSEHLITKKCLNLHGHTGKIMVEYEQDNLRAGMVLDFSAIKEIINSFDHKTILNMDDPLYHFLLTDNAQQLVPAINNPTIEEICKLISHQIWLKYPDLKNLVVSGVEGYKGEDSPIVRYET